MQPLPVVDLLNERSNRARRLGPIAIRLPVHLLSFQCTHEAFRHRIVPRTTSPAHGRLNARPFQSSNVIATGILHALIRVVDQRTWRYVTIANGHGQRRQREFGP